MSTAQGSQPREAELWEPLHIGALELRNRIVVTAHETNFGTVFTRNDGMTDRYVDYLALRAAGGAAVVMPGGTVPHPSGERFGHLGIWREESLLGYRRLADAVHDHGARTFIQLFHAGPQDWGTDELENWHPPLAASQLPSPSFGRVAKPAEAEEIAAIAAAYGLAAARLREAGIDGLEISAGHGYLLHTFLSPLTNLREDRYGGDVAGRCLIVRELLEAMRASAGRDFPIGIRLSFDDYLGGAGITADVSVALVAEMHSWGLLDYFSVSGGTYPTNTRMIPPALAGLGTHFAENGKLARRVVGGEVPVLVASGVRTVEDAARLLEDGAADLIGMARAHIADPELVNKARAGRAEEIRRCVGANQGCVRRLAGKNMFSCTVNPAVGREGEISAAVLSAPSASLRVLVVGGGPAGMKAAESAAERGHTVTLVERETELGGQLRLAGRIAGRSAWLELADDLAGSLRRVGVEVRLGEEVDAGAVAAIEPDRVVLATGSRYLTDGFSSALPFRDGIPGANLDHVCGPETAISEPERLGRRVVIVDETGEAMPLALAVELQEGGRRVEFVTSRLHAGDGTLWTFEFPWLYPRLKQAGARVHDQSLVTEIRPGSVGVASIWGAGEILDLEADSVVLITERRSEADLYEALRESGVEVDRLGDCLAPRDVDEAINDGFQWGLGL